MAKNFSPEQRLAIDTRDRTLLVSAAAGSGKTTTLTQRIIDSLLDKNSPESIADMLIVTFTNASVSDMREKIGRALTEAVNENPDNKEIEKQLHLLPGARICTIDSFCNEILRTNAETVGITPGYRIAESAEAEILSYSIMESLINSIYENELNEIATSAELDELSDCLTSSKQTSKLAETLLSLYKKTTSAIEGVAAFDALVKKYDVEKGTPIEDTQFGRDVIEYADSALKHYTEVLSALADSVKDEEMFEKDLYESDIATVKKIINERSYSQKRQLLLDIKYGRVKSVKEMSSFLVFARDKREKIKKSIAKLRTDFFSYTEEQWWELYSDLHRVLSVLIRLLKKFDEDFTEEKKRRGMLEHSDVERFAYRCLYNPDGSKTDIAEGYASLFSSVYIDEYQDVNALQNAIFDAVSNKRNRFMVGDIKQSIYRFRSARPEIFESMKSSYPKLDSEKEQDAASIFLSNNYRCDEGIIDFVNSVFDKAFGILGGSIGYVSEDKLNHAKIYDKYPKPPYDPAKIIITEKPPKEKSDDAGDIAEDDETDDDEALYENEPALVAKKIKELLDSGRLASGKAIAPSDIAIVLRKNNSIEKYSEALSELGIPSTSRDSKNFFLNSEVLLALCLLNAIDNPKREVYLAGLMCSPLYGITPDELVKIRKSQGRSKNLYDAVKKYSSEHPEDIKISAFLDTLMRYREISEGMNVDALIARLYRETGLIALASKHGGKENLILLYNYARKFEGSSYKGLYNFINYINNIIDSKAKFADEKRDTGDSNAVKIVTIHSSKGLEYPIVFLTEASKKFSNLDKKEKFAYSEEYGLSVYLRAPMGLALARNPIHHAIQAHMDRKYIEEELRVLYVALTRAQERLYVVGTCTDDDMDAFLDSKLFNRRTLGEYSLIKSTSFFDVILSTADENAKIEIVKNKTENELKSDTDSASSENESVEKEKDATVEPQEKTSYVITKESIREEADRRFEYKYPKFSLTSLPEKMSVSRLSPKVLDGSDDTDDLFIETETEKIEDQPHTVPAFISGKEEDAAAKGGVATHTVLQFANFKNLSKLGVDAEICRLIKEGYISEDDAKRVEKGELVKFTRSQLFNKMLNSTIYREFRFNTHLPAEKFTSKEELKADYSGTDVLVQGVIDCIIVDENGKITVVDYKTDRLTKEERADREAAKKKLAARHELQLYYYSLAVEKIFSKAPDTVGVYSLAFGDFIEIEPPII